MPFVADSLCAGPLDIKEAKWEGVQLLYVVPKGKGNLIDDSFGDTPDMLSFFSKRTGVKYAWPKYAQNAMYDFGGGNVNSDVGIGVRLDLPIGPVRIDYGFPMQKDKFSSGSGQFNFNIGYQF